MTVSEGRLVYQDAFMCSTLHDQYTYQCDTQEWCASCARVLYRICECHDRQ